MSEYKLLSGDSVRALNAIVNEYLALGWQLHGHTVAFGMHNTPAVLYQAVVKPDRVERPVLMEGVPVDMIPVPTGAASTKKSQTAAKK